MMVQLAWAATPDGWRSGRYRIEGDPDAGWTLSIEELPEPALPDGVRPITPTRSRPMSLEAAKQAALRHAVALDRMQQVRRHSVRALAAAGGLALAFALPGAWTYPVAFASMFVGLREGMSVVDVLTSRARIVERRYQ